MPTIDNVANDEDIATTWGNDVADTLNDECAKWDATDEWVTSPDGSLWIGGDLPAIVLTKTSSQSIADATGTNITWQNEVTRIGGFSATSGAVTIPAGAGGLYAITLNGQWAPNATGIRSLAANIGNNGSISMPSAFGQIAPGQTAAGNWMAASIIARLQAAATITATCYQNSTGNLGLAEASLSVVMVRHIP